MLSAFIAQWLTANEVQMLTLDCNGKKRYVMDIVIHPKALGCSLVNKGHDDLFDLGYGVEELSKYGLKITDDSEDDE